MFSLLVKFAHKREHLEQMQKGLIYCTQLKYFSDLEDGGIRGDRLESVIESTYSEGGTLEVKPINDPKAEWSKFQLVSSVMRTYIPNPVGNLFCMSNITINPQKESSIFVFDEKFRSFGDYVLLILNQKIFDERLNKAYKKQKLQACVKLVEYLDLKKYSGKKSVFQKDISYSWQQELRFFFNRKSNDTFQFSIGNIEDISKIYDFKELKAFTIRLP